MSKMKLNPLNAFSHKFFMAICIIHVSASAVTNQFRGVNWADTRDNFQSGVLYLSGLSSTDTYQSASIVAERVIGQFVTKIGSNSVRLPINEATVENYWGTYTGVIDVALTKGKVILCYWSYRLEVKPTNMDAFWAMWQKVIDKYGNNPNCYFEVFNEPNGYTKAELLALYDSWLKRYTSIPHGRVILDGTGLAWNVPDVGSDARFKDCLLAVHDYSFFANYTNETQWSNHLKGFVGAYADRTVMTEFGAPMLPGPRDGTYYEAQDYNSPPGTYFVAYLRGITSQLREWKMGSFYWIGLRDNDWYSITKKTGSGANINLEITNQSGLDRIHYSWTDTVPAVVIPDKRTQFFNGDFSLGTQGWTFNVWQGGGSGVVNNGQYELDVSSVGTNTHSIQVLQSGLVLTQGKQYRLQFDAYASVNRSIEVIAQLNSTPWTRYFAEPQIVTLSTSKSTYAIVFTMNAPTDSNSRISFNAGLSTGKVFLDNISIQEEQPTSTQQTLHNTQWSIKNNRSLLTLYVSQAVQGSLEILDLNGRSIHTLHSGLIPAGDSQYQINNSLKSGLYLIRFKTPHTQSIKRILIKTNHE